MKRFIAFVAIFSTVQLAASAATFEELVSQGDSAVQSKDYQKAENAYIDAVYATHASTAEPPLMDKLNNLYKVSGLSPLDSTIKEKIERFRKTPKTPGHEANATAKPAASAASATLQPFTGPMAQTFLANCKLALENLGRSGMKNFVGMENFQGSVLKLSDKMYRVDCSVDFVATDSRVPVDAVTVVQETSPHKFEEISSEVTPRGAGFAATSGQPGHQDDSFSQWLRAQHQQNVETDAETIKANIEAKRAAEYAENAQLKEIEEKTRQAEENSNSSNRKSKNH